MSREADDPPRLAFDLARSQLASQKEDLRALRGQAALAAAISGLFATIFATILVGSDVDLSVISIRSNPLIYLYAAAFAASSIFAVKVAVDWSTCTFDQSPKWILDHQKKGEDFEKIIKSLAIEAEEFFDENNKEVERIQGLLWWALVLGWLQLPFGLMLIFDAIGAT